jgi:hypothetical protein
MRRTRFDDEQIGAAFQEADLASVAETADKDKVSDQGVYAWRRHFAGMKHPAPLHYVHSAIGAIRATPKLKHSAAP